MTISTSFTLYAEGQSLPMSITRHKATIPCCHKSFQIHCIKASSSLFNTWLIALSAPLSFSLCRCYLVLCNLFSPPHTNFAFCWPLILLSHSSHPFIFLLPSSPVSLLKYLPSAHVLQTPWCLWYTFLITQVFFTSFKNTVFFVVLPYTLIHAFFFISLVLLFIFCDSFSIN